MRHMASSLSSVTWPGDSRQQPPPGILSASSIRLSGQSPLSNSRYEPIESPINAPSMLPRQAFCSKLRSSIFDISLSYSVLGYSACAASTGWLLLTRAGALALRMGSSTVLSATSPSASLRMSPVNSYTSSVFRLKPKACISSSTPPFSDKILLATF